MEEYSICNIVEIDNDLNGFLLTYAVNFDGIFPE